MAETSLLAIRRWPLIKTLETVGILAGILYAIVTTLQWRDLRHNFEVDQRAWIKIKYGFSDPVNTLNLSPVGLLVSNVGKSPALQQTIVYAVEIVGANGGPSLVLGPNRTGYNITILSFPGDSDTNPAFLFDSHGQPRPLSQKEVDSLIAGDSYLTVFGMATYSDQFGPHWTRFCGWHGHEPANKAGFFNARDCTLWNATGDGKPPQ